MRALAVLVALAVATGCAKFPSQGGGAGGKILIFTLRVDGKIRGINNSPNNLPFVYMVAIRTSNESNPVEDGPFPVIGQPWGNGFVAGGCTHFVWWNPLQFPSYGLYRFVDTSLNQYEKVGVPVNYVEPSDNGKEIKFEISLNQLAPNPEAAAALQSLQVNFLAMSEIPPPDRVSRPWDALGDPRAPLFQINSPVVIPLNSSAIYNNSNFNDLEPLGDQPDPDLDIVNWQVEVRIP